MSKTNRTLLVMSSGELFRKLIVSLIVFCVGLGMAKGAVLSWSGGGVNGSWNNSANWGFAGTPANGDTLIFPAFQPMLINSNNIANLVLSDIRFAGGGGGYSISGNAFTITNSIMATNSAGVNAINNNITLTTTDIVINVAANLIVAGSLSGSVGVTKTGSGTLTYSTGGFNTYTGTTRVNGGVLQLNALGIDGAFAGPLIISDGSVGATVRLSLSVEIPNNVPITINNLGTLDLNGSGEDIGNSLTMSGDASIITGVATLTLGANSTVTANPGILSSCSISGNLNINSGTCAITVNPAIILSGSFSVPAVVSGTANITKAGNGTLFLDGANTFSGLLTINAGTVSVDNSFGLGTTAAGTIVNAGASLDVFGGITVTNESLTLASAASVGGLNNGSGSNTWTGPITLSGATTINVASGGVLNLMNSAVSGSGGFSKLGTGTLFFSGSASDTFTGDVVINDGLLLLGRSSQSLSSSVNSITIGDGNGAGQSDVLQEITGNQIFITVPITINSSGLLNLSNVVDDIGSLTFNGGTLTTTGTGRAQFGSDVLINTDTNSNANISGSIELLSGTHIFNVASSGFFPPLMLSASIQGSGGMTKNGTGEIEMTGAGTYTGLVTVNAGSLLVENDTALGSTSAGTIVNSPGRVLVRFDTHVGAEAITINGVGPSANGCFGGVLGSNSWAGPITLGSASTIAAFASAGDQFNLSGGISGTGPLTKTGPSIVTFSGAVSNSYTGTTTVNQGTLQLGVAATDGAIPGNLVVSAGTIRLLGNQQIDNGADVQLDPGTLWDFGTFFEDIDTLHGSGNITYASGGFLEIGINGGTSTYDGVMSGIGFGGGYTVGKFGAGTFTMNGNNTYINQTRVWGGKMVVNGIQPQSPVIVNNGTTFGGNGTVGTINCFGTLAPGSSPGIINSSNLTFFASGTYAVELTGPNPGPGGYDQMNVSGTNQIAAANLNVTANFTSPVAVGDQFTIIQNDGADAISGTFNALPNGSAITTGGYTFTISYAGGSGNDVVLTLTNVPGAGGASFITSGNGDHAISPDECNSLDLVISNKTGIAMAGVTATLSTTTFGVVINQPYSDYPNVPGNGSRTNITPFQLSTLPAFVCSSDINLELIVNTVSHGSFIVPFVLHSGSPSVAPVRFDNNIVTNVPDVGTIESTNNVATWSGGPLTKVVVSLWLSAPIDSDLNLTLLAPGGASVDLSSGNGGGANFGTGSADGTRTTFDDAAATSITAGAPPFVGTFRPEVALSNLLVSPVGDWRLRVQDTGFFGAPDTLRAWSLFLYGTTCAPGGGACDYCMTSISDAITLADPVQTNRWYREGIISSCASPKPWFGFGDTGPSFHYDAYTFTNTTTDDACVSVVLQSGFAVMAAAYLGSYNPNAIDQNFLGDGGSSTEQVAGGVTTFSVSIPAGAQFVVVVNEVNQNTGTQPYTLSLSGLPCPPPQLVITSVSSVSNRVDWPTWAGGFKLESNTNLSTTNWVLVPNEPVEFNNRFAVTNSSAIPTNQFYRLHKP